MRPAALAHRIVFAVSHYHRLILQLPYVLSLKIVHRASFIITKCGTFRGPQFELTELIQWINDLPLLCMACMLSLPQYITCGLRDRLKEATIHSYFGIMWRHAFLLLLKHSSFSRKECCMHGAWMLGLLCHTAHPWKTMAMVGQRTLLRSVANQLHAWREDSKMYRRTIINDTMYMSCTLFSRTHRERETQPQPTYLPH
jgi:hypothetical protein